MVAPTRRCSLAVDTSSATAMKRARRSSRTFQGQHAGQLVGRGALTG
jgi:hypothetical protein